MLISFVGLISFWFRYVLLWFTVICKFLLLLVGFG